MSKTMLTTADVPQYIREIASRLRPTTQYGEKDLAGYTFLLYGRHKVGYESQLETDCDKLIAWCRRYYADAFITEKHFWYDEVEMGAYAVPKQVRQKAYRIGYRNHIKLVITDPVAFRFEKDGFYKEQVLEGAKSSLSERISNASERAGSRAAERGAGNTKER